MFDHYHWGKNSEYLSFCNLYSQSPLSLLRKVCLCLPYSCQAAEASSEVSPRVSLPLRLAWKTPFPYCLHESIRDLRRTISLVITSTILPKLGRKPGCSCHSLLPSSAWTSADEKPWDSCFCSSFPSSKCHLSVKTTNWASAVIDSQVRCLHQLLCSTLPLLASNYTPGHFHLKPMCSVAGDISVTSCSFKGFCDTLRKCCSRTRVPQHE